MRCGEVAVIRRRPCATIPTPRCRLASIRPTHGPCARSSRKPHVKLGFAVKVLGEELPTHDSRRWQSNPHLRWSIEALHAIFDFLEPRGIRMYRMSPALAPYATHPDLPQFHGQVAECRDELAALGERARPDGGCASAPTRASTSS